MFNNTCCRCLYSRFLVAGLFMLNIGGKTLQASNENLNLQGEQLFFEKNLGQIADTEGQLQQSILYKVHSGNANLYLKKTSIVWILKRFEETGYTDQRIPGSIQTENPPNIYMARMDFELIGANPDPVILENGTQHSVSHYYKAHCPDGILNISHFGQIVYKDIYPGIDWSIVTRDNSIKYEFIVHPSADPSIIRWKYNGAQTVSLNNGNLLAQTSNGMFVKENEPYSYQVINGVAEEVPFQFVIEDAIVHFQSADYDHSTDLIIDPEMVWGTYFGSSTGEYSRSLTADRFGNAILCGHTVAVDIPVLPPGGSAYYQGSNNGFNDVWIAKFNGSGIQQWTTYYGGTSGDGNWSVTTDNDGNIIVGGDTSSDDFPLQNAHQGTMGSSNDIFVIKLDSNANRQWATYFGGDDWERAESITTDNNGNIFVTGFSESTDFPTVDPGGGAFMQTTMNGSSAFGDCCIMAFDKDGTAFWATLIGGGGDDVGRGIDTDEFGNLFVAGAASFDFPIQNFGGAFNQGFFGGGNGDFFIAKFNTNRNMVWCTQYGGNGVETAYGVAVDMNNDVFVTGFTNSSNFPPFFQGGNEYQQVSLGGGDDAFLTKFSNTGARLWATYFGGVGSEGPFDCETDPCGNLFITGYSQGGGLPVKDFGGSSYYDDTYGGGAYDAAMMMFSNEGELYWASYYGGSGNDRGRGLGIDALGNVFIGGTAESAGLDMVDPGGAYYKPNIPSALSPFILKFSGNVDCCIANSLFSVSNSSLCPDDSLNINNLSTGSTFYQWQIDGNDYSTAFDTTFDIIGFGVHSISLIVDTGVCIDTFQLPVTINAGPVADAGEDVTIPESTNTQLTGSGGNSGIWTPSTNLSCDSCYNPTASPTVTTTYYLTVEDAFGCKSVDSVMVTVESGCDAWLPNIFSPNDDAVNDVLYVEGNCIEKMNLEIYNSWGEMLFSTKDKAVGWNGEYQGIKMVSDTYMYFLNGELTNGSSFSHKGDVNLVR